VKPVIEAGKKVTGMIKIVEETGDIKYEIIQGDKNQKEKEKEGLYFFF